MIAAETGTPPVNGTYAAEVYFGWKILAWRDGEWWHESHTGRWTASVPLQWIGPFPALLRKTDAPASPRYDL